MLVVPIDAGDHRRVRDAPDRSQEALELVVVDVVTVADAHGDDGRDLRLFDESPEAVFGVNGTPFGRPVVGDGTRREQRIELESNRR